MLKSVFGLNSTKLRFNSSQNLKICKRGSPMGGGSPAKPTEVFKIFRGQRGLGLSPLDFSIVDIFLIGTVGVTIKNKNRKISILVLENYIIPIFILIFIHFV